ncbi:11823_t:CDS:1, partial [Racocetra persica]
EQILQTFQHSQQLASELAEFLEMIQLIKLLVDIYVPIIFIDNNNDDILMDSHSVNNESETSEDCEINLSTAINDASSEIQKISKQLE